MYIVSGSNNNKPITASVSLDDESPANLRISTSDTYVLHGGETVRHSDNYIGLLIELLFNKMQMLTPANSAARSVR